MTTQTEALKLALEALKRITHRFDLESVTEDATKAITAAEEALAQPAVAEQHKHETSAKERKPLVCIVCQKEMPQRNGKFGPFSFCPNGHGTVSIQGSKMRATGAIFTKMAEREQARRELARMEATEMPDINQAVLRGMASMGVFMNDMDHFIEGGREAAKDEADHWMNGRPY